MHCKPLIIDYFMYAQALFSCIAQIPHINIWKPKFAFGYYFYQLSFIGPFLKTWPLKKVFRGHFGPVIKFCSILEKVNVKLCKIT